MAKDFFAEKAGIYEQNKGRVDNVSNIANSIIDDVHLDASMHLMDFGAGTGLLLERVAPYVRKITAVDVSASMNEQLNAKRDKLPCELDILQIDLEVADIDQQFDGIISSMTMHHVRDIAAMLRKFHSLLRPAGFIAIADLDAEDGSFHTEDTGVFHQGFKRQEIAEMARAAGFIEVSVTGASVIHKPHGDFPVFLLKAVR